MPVRIGVGAIGAAPFVGRERELDRLAGVLEEGRCGRGAVVLVTGEAGAGKSRLVREALDRDGDDARLLLSGAGWDGGGAPAYWPWIQVLRGVVDHLGAERTRALIPDWDRTAGMLLPETAPAARAGGPPSPEERPGEPAARFALFDGVGRVLRAVAREVPVVVTLDDLHLADRDSLLLTEFVAGALADAPVVLVVAHRTALDLPEDAPAGASLLALRAGAVHLELSGLTEDEVAQLVRAHEPRAAAPLLAARLHAVTDGNPLFVGECLRLLADEGTLGDAEALRDRGLSLPPDLRDTIVARLAGVPADVRAVLDVAAVIGREFSADTLAAACGLPAGETLELLDRGLALRVLRESDPRAGRFAFRHGAVRESLYAQLSLRRRAESHERVATALEDAGRAHPSELAHHWIGAAPVVGPARGLEAARTAGAAAVEALAHGRAAEFFADALAALDGLAEDEDLRCSLLLDLGTAQMAGGEPAAARATLERAADLAAALGDDRRRARAALGSAPWGLSLSVADDPLTRMLRDALGGRDLDDATRARLLGALAVAEYWVTGPQERLAQVEEAIALARSSGDPATLARALTDAHIATWSPDGARRSLAWLDEVGRLGVADTHPELVLTAETCRISLLVESGQYARGDEAIASVARGARDVRQPRAQAYVLRHEALRAGLEGRFAEVEALLERQAAIVDLSVDSVEALLLTVQAFAMRWTQGRLPELEPAIRQFADNLPVMPAWRCALLVAYVQQGRREAVRRGFRDLAADGFASLPRDNLYLASLTLLTDACAYLADAEGARLLEGLIAPYADRTAVVTDAAVFAPMSRSMGRLAAVLGRRDEALGWLARAREDAAVLGARPLLAHLDVDEAAVRGRLGDDDERAEVARLLDRAGALARELELAEVVRRSRDLRAVIAGPDGTRAPRPAAPAPAPAPAPADGPALRRRGEVWEIAWSGRVFSVRDVKGLHHLARLLAEPEREFAAVDLVGGRAAAGADAGALAQEGLTAGGESSGAVLDEQAKRAYRARLTELEEEIEEAAAFHDPEREAGARREREAIVAELAGALGLGGRDRAFTSTSERARVNATRAIRSAIDRVARADPALGRHLSLTVRTGAYCAYRPEPPAPRWEVEAR